jgi:hypothetical protein
VSRGTRGEEILTFVRRAPIQLTLAMRRRQFLGADLGSCSGHTSSSHGQVRTRALAPGGMKPGQPIVISDNDLYLRGAEHQLALHDTGRRR